MPMDTTKNQINHSIIQSITRSILFRIFIACILSNWIVPISTFAAHTTTTADTCAAVTATLQDTCYTSGNQRWWVGDGTNWLLCPGGACPLLQKDYCHRDFTTTIGVSHATADDGLIVAGSGSDKIYVCGGLLIPAGTVSVKLIRSSGATCAGTDGNLMEAVPLTAQVGFLIDPGMETTAGASLCINLNAAISVTGYVVYRKQL